MRDASSNQDADFASWLAGIDPWADRTKVRVFRR